jgi:hypothetical protein
MEKRAQRRHHMILLVVVLKKEVAHRMLIRISKFIVDERFGEDRLATPRIRRDPKQVVV